MARQKKKKHLITARQPLYAVLKYPIYLGLFIFYRKYKFKGFKNIPDNKPLIFAFNHQNAFLDPLVAAPLSHSKQITFLLRASIYKNKKFRPLLRGINLMPIYRQLDGVDITKENIETFENCVYLLENKRPLFIFPEGSHVDKRTIRPVKKGLIRIAFDAEVRNDFNLNVTIIPVGINYSDPYRFGSDVFLHVGKPIYVSSYKEIYAKNPAAVMNQLRLEVDKGLRELSIDIQALDLYDEVEMVRKIMVNEIHPPNKRALHLSFDTSKKIIREAESHPNRDWVQAATEYKKITEKIRVHDYMIKPGYKLKNDWLWALFFVLLSPVFLVGSILNYIPFHTPVMLSKKLVKDPVFVASIVFGAALVLFPVYYIIMFLLVGFIASWKWALLAAGVGITSGVVALFYYRKWKKFSAWRRLTKLKNCGDKEVIRALELRKTITDTFAHVI